MSRLAARLLLAVPTLLGVTLVTFALVHLLPGDPGQLRAGEGRGVTAQVIEENRALAGLDQPLGRRYLRWLGRSARLDFGRSLADGRPVRARVGEALLPTVALGLLAALLAVGIGLPLGALSALRAGRPEALLIELALTAAYAVPVLALGLLLLRAGAPYGGGSLVGLLAPALCLCLPSLVVMAQQQRAALRSALASDPVRGARAKGAGPLRVLLVHALPIALLPMVTLIGSQVPWLLSGSVIVERIFGLGGLGELGYQSLLARDYPTVMALTTVAAVLSIGGMLVADLAAVLLDPRLRAHAGAPPGRRGAR